MIRILAIDPGNVESAYALIDADTRRPVWVDKMSNDSLRMRLLTDSFGVPGAGAIEMIESYGMPVGREVFETCVWIGRFIEVSSGILVPFSRREVKLHHCQDSRAKDSNIAQALIDRFALNVPNRGKGTKAAPGWFYGFRADIWQAYALAVLVADRLHDEEAAG